jgi:hypothetical protein
MMIKKETELKSKKNGGTRGSAVFDNPRTTPSGDALR